MIIVAGYFLQAVALLLDTLLTLAMWLIIARAILSWVSPDPWNPIVRTITRLTEPVLHPIRRRLPWLGGIDLSPIVVLLAIFFLQSFLVRVIQHYAATLLAGG